MSSRDDFRAFETQLTLSLVQQLPPRVGSLLLLTSLTALFGADPRPMVLQLP